MKKQLFLLFIECCLIVLISFSSLNAQQRELTLFITDRKRSGGLYTADIWITLRPGFNWKVSDTKVWVKFKLEALSPAPYHNQPILNLDPELAAAGYSATQFYWPFYAVVGIDLLAPVSYNACVEKQGGSIGYSFRLGTLRWNITRDWEMDYIRFAYDAANPLEAPVTVFNHRTLPKNTDEVITSLNFTNGSTSNNTFQNLYISPNGCSYKFYNQPQSCTDNLTEISTETPLAIISPHWPVPPGPGIQTHKVYYQYDMNTNNLPTGTRTRNFDPSLLASQLDQARCRWETQIDQLIPPTTNVFEWQPTSIGGRFYFSRNFRNLSTEEFSAGWAMAVTNMARSNSIYYHFKDTSECGAQIPPVAFNRRSEIVFNNSDVLWTFNPHLRWTTDITGCGNSPDCINFHAVALHEVGHYLGLAHEDRNHTVVMTGADIFPLPGKISQCDADNIRRLYNAGRIGTLPDNEYNCETFTIAEELLPPINATKLFAVFPSPTDRGICTVRYSLQHPGPVIIRIRDILGKEFASFSEYQQYPGQYQLSIPTHNLTSGLYFVMLQTSDIMLSQEFIVRK